MSLVAMLGIKRYESCRDEIFGSGGIALFRAGPLMAPKSFGHHVVSQTRPPNDHHAQISERDVRKMSTGFKVCKKGEEIREQRAMIF